MAGGRIKRYSWAEVEQLTRDLFSILRRRELNFDAIIAILRGGALPAVHLAHLLHVRDVRALLAKTTTSDSISPGRQRAEILQAMPLTDLSGRSLLIVDDVVNSGATIQAIKVYVEHHRPASVVSAALVWDRLSPNGELAVGAAPVDVVVEVTDCWVMFPWNE